MIIVADGIHSTVINQIFFQTTAPLYVNENIFYEINQQTSINPSITAKNTLTQYLGFGEFISYRAG